MPDATPFVLIPGLLGSPQLYREQTTMLWSEGAVMLTNSSLDDSIAAIAGRILAGAPARFTLVGLSMGGYVAFEILRQAPQRVARLILLDTSARADSAEVIQAREQQIGQVGAGGFDAMIDDAYGFCVHPSRLTDDALRAAIRQMAGEVGPAGFIRQQRAIIGRADSRPLLAQIHCPTLVLVGDADRLTPIENAQEIAAGIRGASLVTVPACGHVSTLERPAFVNETIAAWLRATPPAG
ncbi:alpha/beta fold hydrolase [Affinibrenneria salicis]|uniref:Alpha/beta fold hydrolase n=1 Tax=Affinibrenneria salicis TaxID=2590031 RepID=A0A5J5FY00_9GAMM|nr:alpha/beta fold hydrolase [Affinibrenneria salicis]KAA8999002.1 alpha/beta fold hydrolase [Affinibrenneria salicis]